MLFAVTDIETTGSHAEGNAIIEIGIIITDGEKELSRYETLVNPNRPLDKYIQGLTGITPAMLTPAPSWDEVAPKVFEILSDKIFVAHNVQFDYSFIQFHLQKQGYRWQAPKLDTIKLTRHFFRKLPKYGLSSLIDHFNIEVPSRHRALGDAIAATYLLHKAISQSSIEAIKEMALKKYQHQQLSPYIDGVSFEQLPEQPGVYYFLNEFKKIVYVGKAKNIKKRVLTHFYGNNTTERKQALIKEVRQIQYQTCINELHALLLESVEIKRYWPKFNKSQKATEFNYGVYAIPTVGGLQRIVIEKAKLTITPIILHPNKKVLQTWLHQAATISNACFCLTGSGVSKKCDLSKCSFSLEALTEKEKTIRIQKTLQMVVKQPSFIIHHHKKNVGHLYIYVKKGSVVGWKMQEQYVKPYLEAAVAKIITPVRENLYLRKYISKHINEEPKNVYWLKEENKTNK
jgi:DNA polymerase III subunit epsilon